jgi:hypothetical protein
MLQASGDIANNEAHSKILPHGSERANSVNVKLVGIAKRLHGT